MRAELQFCRQLMKCAVSSVLTAKEAKSWCESNSAASPARSSTWIVDFARTSRIGSESRKAKTMEAILEVFVALIAALAEIVVLAIQLAVEFAAIVLEFMFIAVFHGIAAASKRYRERKLTLAEKRQRSAAALSKQSESDLDPKVMRATRQAKVIITSILIAIICVPFALHLKSQARKKRIAETNKMIEQMAESYAVQVRNGKGADLREGQLPGRDAWGQPVELFLDQMHVATMIVVRSHGPDHKSGSIDDLLAIRIAKAPVKQIIGNAVHQGIQAAAEKLKDVLPGKKNAENDAKHEAGR